jgi:TPR repeat protein
MNLWIALLLARTHSVSYRHTVTLVPVHWNFTRRGEMIERIERVANCGIDPTSVNVSAIHEQAKRGVAEAQHLMGELHLYGLLPGRSNLSRAVKLFGRAAAQGFSESHARLSFMYRHGIGVSEDSAKASAYGLVAARGGSISALLTTGMSHLMSNLSYFSARSAIATPYPVLVRLDAMWRAGQKWRVDSRVLRRDLTLPPSPETLKKKERAKWQDKSKRGNMKAQIKLDFSCHRGPDDCKIDYERTRKICEAHPNSFRALYLLGEIYRYGLGVHVNVTQAMEFYEKSCTRYGHLFSLEALGALKQEIGELKQGQELLDNATTYWAKKRGEPAQGRVTFLRRDGQRGNCSASRVLFDLYLPDNRTEALFWLQLGIGTGPWWRMHTTADNFWRMGNQQAAILLWMEFSDWRDQNGTLNAGLALSRLRTNEEFFLSNDQRLRVASKMFQRISDGWPGVTTSDFVWLCDERQGRILKGTSRLLSTAQDPWTHLAIAEAQIDGHIPGTIKGLFGKLSLAMEGADGTWLAVIGCSPKLLKYVGRRVMRCTMGKCDFDEIRDLKDCVHGLWKSHRTAVMFLSVYVAVVAFIIVWMRMRRKADAIPSNGPINK